MGCRCLNVYFDAAHNGRLNLTCEFKFRLNLKWSAIGNLKLEAFFDVAPTPKTEFKALN